MTSTEERRTLRLHLLTPVFIGSGEKLSRFEYVLEQSGSTQRILVADVNRMLEVAGSFFGERIVARLEQAALETGEQARELQRGLAEVLLETVLERGGGTPEGWLRQQRAVAEELQLDPAASPRISSGQTSAQPPQGRGPQGGAQRRAQTEYQIQRHLRTPEGRCYIPGSELKGSLRVAVLYRLLSEGSRETAAASEQLERALRGVSAELARIDPRAPRDERNRLEGRALDRLKSAARHLDAQLLRLPNRQGDAKFDLFRFIHITDTGLVAADRVAVLSAEVQPVGGTSAGNRQGRIPMFIEALLPGTELECTLTVTRPDSALVRRWCEGRLPEHMRRVLSVDWLLEAWRQKSQAVLEADMAQADVLRPALGTLLRVGWGQGLLATTVDLYIKKNWPNLYQDVIARLLSRRRQPSAAFPTSRRVAHCNGRLWPLGWIRLG
jgi:CRISPR type III-A-associated RAMP protein Csm5